MIRLLPGTAACSTRQARLFGRDEATLRRLLALPHGMILITGPTGSGKTTTLATMLSILNEPTRKILTIEDPVEYEIPGINQSQVKPAIGLTFATALRSFVRQDPDVIMVGEIRDSETANIAIHAALTGHLVLSTLHTETAAAAVPRLLDLGVEGLSAALDVARRGRAAAGAAALRPLQGAVPRRRSARDRRDFRCDAGDQAGETLWQPRGCERCGRTGYRGRIGVFELLELTGGVRELIGEHTDGFAIDQMAIREGMTTMLDDGVAKCRAGLTTPVGSCFASSRRVEVSHADVPLPRPDADRRDRARLAHGADARGSASAASPICGCCRSRPSRRAVRRTPPGASASASAGRRPPR